VKPSSAFVPNCVDPICKIDVYPNVIAYLEVIEIGLLLI
jgi:hypothetical protein